MWVGAEGMVPLFKACLGVSTSTLSTLYSGSQPRVLEGRGFVKVLGDMTQGYNSREAMGEWIPFPDQENPLDLHQKGKKKDSRVKY